MSCKRKIFLHGTENVPRGTREPGGRSPAQPLDAGRTVTARG